MIGLFAIHASLKQFGIDRAIGASLVAAQATDPIRLIEVVQAIAKDALGDVR